MRIGERRRWTRDRWDNVDSRHMVYKPYRTFDASVGERWRSRPEIERTYSRYTSDRASWLDSDNYMSDSDSDKERKRGVAEQVRSWMRMPFVVFDTETTGLDEDAEIVSIGIVSSMGWVALDTLIRPTMPIPAEASAIHGITDADVKDAPTFVEVYPVIREALSAKRWAGYNLNFDTGKLSAVIRRHGLEPISPAKAWIAWHDEMMWQDDEADVMGWYAEWWGDWHDYFGNYRWQKLANARTRHKLHEGRDHGALDDAITTLRLIEFLGGYDG